MGRGGNMMRMALTGKQTSDENDAKAPLLPQPRIARSQSVYVVAALSAVATIAAFTAAGLLLLVLFSVSVPRSILGTTTRSRMVEADVGVVAADHVLCSDIGVDILKKGGNAIDSAIATVFCQGVANPGASGIGGGDFMLIRLANGQAEAFDFRETAPLLASERMYANNMEGKMVGGLAIAVPGQVKGLYAAWEKHGTLPWKSLVEPAIRLAADGFPLPPYLASQIRSSLTSILADKGLRDVFAPNGIPLQEGDIYSHKKLAETLRAIAERGADAFYRGAIAKAMVEDVRAAGGIMTEDDLRNYRVEITPPVVAETWGHTVLGFPPPSSGGAGLIMILNILAAFKDVNAIKGDLGLHHIVEAFKHTYAVRANLGDPDFENVTGVIADMVSPEFAASLQMTIEDNTSFGPEHYGGKYQHMNEGNEHGTSHVSIVDGERNAVAITCTVNFPFGAKVLSEQTGILLNNEMSDFATPDDNTTNGLPAKPNFIKPLKRPLSTMSPTIVLENGQLKAVLGASGGLKILTTVAQVLLLVIAGCDPLTAVSSAHVHHQFLPNDLLYENFTTLTGETVELPLETQRFLSERGHHEVLQSSALAVSQIVVQDLTRPSKLNGKSQQKNKNVFFGKLIGVSDPRKDGYPSGY